MKRISSPLQPVVLCLILLAIAPIVSARESDSTQSIQVGAGWNLLSLPATVSNGTTDSLFPTAISRAFVYHNGYHAGDTLQNGAGFWLKFASAETVPVEGEVVLKDTIEVQAGWNIIGSLSMPSARASIQTYPPGIIAGQIFEYVPGEGYQPGDTLSPGLGY
jgi:hypothetical protein